MANGETVRRFEQAFAEYVGAEYAIAMCNGTATLHTALVALGVCQTEIDRGWDGQDIDNTPVAVPPLTMASTTIAVLHAGGVPVFVDVDPDTWLMVSPGGFGVQMPVALYGLHCKPFVFSAVVDAAQTLQPHYGTTGGGPGFSPVMGTHFTSYSFQASKILSTGEGGMLVTNDVRLARRAREFASLGYDLSAGPRGGSSVIDAATLKRPDYKRHFSLGYNYRMADAVAEVGIEELLALEARRLGGHEHPTLYAGSYYREAHEGCPWITAQHVPDGWTHDYWAYTVALESPELWEPFTQAIVRHGGEMPYGCWRITYQEPAFRHLAEDGTCPVAEDLQPRLVQAQTNSLPAARTNADAMSKAIQEIGG